ncbi:MAG TPA: alpha/beta hydrolase [Kribbella sp.]|uniref:alpha/beta hydrolase n=1 Tax=Kribbella sp. TaxID=1871183 RepID=UPI002D766CBC|nr:alpha/beta hydrolase [Kribbella sp.]HET6291975.1 alpha/beta hydrolase [Kribbella sp.]
MREDVTFSSDGRKLAGHLYLPGDRTSAEKLPAVVVVGASSGTKEQTPAVYSQRLVARGYAALAFDHSTYGESEGAPRSDENPFAKSEDIKNAVTYLTGRDEIDADRIAAVGVCGGGGFAPYTAVADRRIKAVATVSGLPDLRSTLTDGFAGDWRDLMRFAQSAREAYAQGGEPQYVPFMPPGEQSDWVENGKQYYLTDRNPDPDWKNQTLVWSFDKMLQYSALDVIHLLSPTPLLLIAGSRAETLQQSQAAHEMANEPKELFLIEGGTHFDFYDRPDYVEPAVAKIDSFLTTHL